MIGNVEQIEAHLVALCEPQPDDTFLWIRLPKTPSFPQLSYKIDRLRHWQICETGPICFRGITKGEVNIDFVADQVEKIKIEPAQLPGSECVHLIILFKVNRRWLIPRTGES